MKTKIEKGHNIENIVETIHNDFPELSKHLLNMPINDSESNEVNVKKLKEYYESLIKIVNEHTKSQVDKNPNNLL